MESIPPETLETLTQWFTQSMSPDPAPRRAAESSLTVAFSSSPTTFPLALLSLLSSPLPPLPVRLAAAIHFKNLLPSLLSSSPDLLLLLDPVKSLLPSLLLSSPPPIQSQLSHSLSILSSHLFPRLWPSLLPDLVSSLRAAASSSNYAAINAVLTAVNSVFNKFRHAFSEDNEVRKDLKYCLDNFAAPLLEMFLSTGRLIASGNHSSPLFESQRICCEIFYSLNAVDLPEFFEDHMGEWMGEFRVYLTATYGAGVEADGTVDGLRASVCECLELYMERFEEEFKVYLNGFAEAVYSLIVRVSAGGGGATATGARDLLMIEGIKFLTSVSRSVHHGLFGGMEAMQQICGSIVFPNVKLREEDEELFEMNYVEYIRRDIEGSDTDTRRRIVCELLKGLAKNYKALVMELVRGQIQSMLARYATNPVENWKDKDAAIYLVVALGSKAGSVEEQLVDVGSFFANVIVPELQSVDVNTTSPILKAGALKFFTAFREQIPKQAVLPLLQNVIGFLKVESNVVHSYAANCIEKLLLVRDKVQTGPNVLAVQPRYTAADIDPLLPLLIPSLSAALQFPDSQENQYVMKCIMRVLKVANLNGEVAKFCVDGLSAILVEVCKNPKSPTFNHYLFEAIAALIGRACEKDPSLITNLELRLFPVLFDILVNDISEFWPYAFQIFAQLIEMSRPPLTANHMQLFEVLLNPDSWKRSANVPALVKLLQAYLRKVPNELHHEGRLAMVLGIFNKLITNKTTEEQGFFVLNTVVENLGYDMIQPYIGHIWTALFTRLQNRKVSQFVKPLVIFMSLLLVKHGPGVLSDSINTVQPNLFLTILQQFWIPNLKLISGFIESKLASVASTRLICEHPSFLDPAAVELWGKMLDSIIACLAQPVKDEVDEADEKQDIPENVGYSASFARLHNAGKAEQDPLKEINDPKEFLVASLARVSAASPGRYPGVIEQYVEPQNRAFLLQLCGSYNRTIV